MTRPRTSLARRTLVQVDRAFWCIHEHLNVMLPLGLPTLAAVSLVTVAFLAAWRKWEFSAPIQFLLFGLVIPLIGLVIFTVLPLPCAVFAWRRAGGEVLPAGECFSYCRRRAGRLLKVIAPLVLFWFLSLLLFSIPLIWVWPRTCLAPLVALFEDQPKIFRRSRRILRQDVAVYVIGGIYLAMAVVLGGLLALPRLVLGTSALGAHVLEAEWRRVILNHLWIFESLSAAIILTALAMSWWISLTLLYHEIRWIREGEDLRQGIVRLREKVLVS